MELAGEMPMALAMMRLTSDGVIERRRATNEDNRFSVMLVFDGDPEPVHTPGEKVIRLDFAP